MPFFSVNLVARKPERATPETNPYFIKFLQTIDWIPNTSAVFCRQTRLSQLSFYRQVDDSIDNVDDKWPHEFQNKNRIQRLGQGKRICSFTEQHLTFGRLFCPFTPFFRIYKKLIITFRILMHNENPQINCVIVSFLNKYEKYKFIVKHG